MQMRQGDILITKVNTIPYRAEKVQAIKGRLILAEGEATGHAHAIAARNAVMHQLAGALYLTILKTAFLQHEEHEQIKLPPGIYKIDRQREYVPGDLWRNVAD